MATKKAAAPLKAAAAPAKAVRGPKFPATKMTDTQVIRFMAEQMDVPQKQVDQFLTLLIDTAMAQTKKVGEFTIPDLGKLVEAQRAARMGPNPVTDEANQDQGQHDGQIPVGEGRKRCRGATSCVALGLGLSFD